MQKCQHDIMTLWQISVKLTQTGRRVENMRHEIGELIILNIFISFPSGFVSFSAFAHFRYYLAGQLQQT